MRQRRLLDFVPRRAGWREACFDALSLPTVIAQPAGSRVRFDPVRPLRRAWRLLPRPSRGGAPQASHFRVHFEGFQGLTGRFRNRGKFPGGGSTWDGANEVGEVWDCGAWNAEAGAEIVEEGDFEFHAGLAEAEHDVTGLAALFADGSARDFALGDEGADVVFRGVGVERDFRPFEHAQKFVFAPEQALQQTVERGIAGSALEDAIELQTQEVRLFRARGALIGPQAPIEPPDRAPHELDGVALLVVGGDELMDEAL